MFEPDSNFEEQRPLILPSSANPVSLDSLVLALRSTSDFVGTAAALDVRTACVFVPTKGWVNFATVARVVKQAEATLGLATVEFPSVKLTRWSRSLDDSLTNEDLRLALTKWREVTEAPIGFAFQDPAHVYRQHRGNQWMESPCWKLDLVELDPEKYSGAGPTVPLLNLTHGMFARHIGELAAEWLGDSAYFTNQFIGNTYLLVISDHRGLIESLSAEENNLVVHVSSAVPALTLHVAAVRTGVRGDRESLIAPVVEGTASFSFKGSVGALDLLVFTPEGECLDRYEESESLASWGASIYNKPRAAFDSDFAAIETAQREGESESTEFKAWVRLKDRADKKTRELIETACAFANSKGGSIFIGVDDDAALYDLRENLKKQYESGETPDLVTRQEAYARDVRKLLNEGVRPSPRPSATWTEIAGLWVLRIDIPQGHEGPYALVESGYYYVRRGATSRKARPSEVREP